MGSSHAEFNVALVCPPISPLSLGPILQINSLRVTTPSGFETWGIPASNGSSCSFLKFHWGILYQMYIYIQIYPMFRRKYHIKLFLSPIIYVPSTPIKSPQNIPPCLLAITVTQIYIHSIVPQPQKHRKGSILLGCSVVKSANKTHIFVWQILDWFVYIQYLSR